MTRLLLPLLLLGTQASLLSGAPETHPTTIKTLAAQSSIPPSLRVFDELALMREQQTAFDAVGPTAPPFVELAPGLDTKRAPFPVHVDSTPAAEARPTDLYDRHAPATFLLNRLYQCGKCDHWHSGGGGTAFGISADGLIATNAHIFEGAGKDDRFVIVTIDGEVRPVVDILAADGDNDVAVARVALPEGESLPHYELTSLPPTGSSIFVLSHPAGRNWVLTSGVVSRHHMIYPEGAKGPAVQRVAIDADFARGSSGAPVLDTQGRVVSLVASTNSVYYKGQQGKNDEGGNPLQMVFHDTVPIKSLLALQGEEEPVSPPEVVAATPAQPENADSPQEAEPPAATSPVEDTPVEDTPAAEAPAEEAPVEDSSPRESAATAPTR
ncbi:S1 family peptidase [Roseibacillus ishigakijimensis]|uniref:Trypsin-like peptidase domain-containing protein n=1 Tax=Roseibacillus ishigakijimensis TaxID=454146 RepID=A0A934RPI0_9BACT|nr:serine protease [Roseibacillus ishigakijimensis]MBK1834578.1 trypsin-like peptidase domain-containing protein [Roseibacillus ishigakijimensis]